MSPTVPRGGRGGLGGLGGLRLRLLSLVLLPLIGVVLIGGAAVSSGLQLAHATASARRSVQIASELSAARSAVSREVLPSFSRSLTADRSSAAAFGLSEAERRQLAVLNVSTVRSSRASTDNALAPLLARPEVRALALTIGPTLRELRQQTDEISGGFDYLYYGYAQVISSLTSAENDAIDWAVKQGLDPDGVAAIAEMRRVSELVRAASEELPYFLGTRLSLGGDPVEVWRRWIGSWSAYTRLSEQIASSPTPAIHEAWARTAHDPLVLAFESALAAAARPGVEGSGSLSLDQILGLTRQSMTRDALLSELMQQAVGRVVRLAEHRRADVRDRVRRLLVLELALAAAALLLVALVGRWLTGPLRRLAQDAQQISEGRLVDVVESGPREVRVVARALAAAVSSLHRMRQQADTVVRGDLDDPVLREPLPGPLGEAMHKTFEQITLSIRAREVLQSDLSHQARHDALTGLPNRLEALLRLEAALAESRRSGSAVGLMFVDLDRFKAVNDTYGHAAGDAVLRTVAHRLRAGVRSGDLACRLGGDEFVVLLESVEDHPALVRRAEGIVAALARPILVDGREVGVGASVGVTVSRDASLDADALLQEADAAAYRAKSAGRGRVEVFDDALRRHLADRARTEDGITRALERDEFVLHFQPLVDVLTGAVHGLEALIRWQRPGHGTVPPMEFIPVAEGSSLVCDIGRWVLHRATAQLAGWLPAQGRQADGVTVAVNLAARHLASPHVVDDVRSALAASGLPGSRLVIELTETMVADDAAVTERLHALRALGVRIAIDDFGTGFTSIAQLQRLPVDIVKIDRSFVAAADPGSAALVRLMVAAAHTLGLGVVAEGVETAEQLELLRELGCDSVQGYLLARPLPLDQVGLHLASALG